MKKLLHSLLAICLLHVSTISLLSELKAGCHVSFSEAPTRESGAVVNLQAFQEGLDSSFARGRNERTGENRSASSDSVFNGVRRFLGLEGNSLPDNSGSIPSGSGVTNRGQAGSDLELDDEDVEMLGVNGAVDMQQRELRLTPPGQDRVGNADRSASEVSIDESVRRFLASEDTEMAPASEQDSIPLKKSWWPLLDSIALPLIAFMLLVVSTLIGDVMNVIQNGKPFGKVTVTMAKMPYTIGYGIYLVGKDISEHGLGGPHPKHQQETYLIPTLPVSNLTYSNCSWVDGGAFDCALIGQNNFTCELDSGASSANTTLGTRFLCRGQGGQFSFNSFINTSSPATTSLTHMAGDAISISFDELKRLMLANRSFVSEVVSAFNAERSEECADIHRVLSGIYGVILNANATIQRDARGTLTFHEDGTVGVRSTAQTYSPGCNSLNTSLDAGVFGELGVRISAIGQVWPSLATPDEGAQLAPSAFPPEPLPTRHVSTAALTASAVITATSTESESATVERSRSLPVSGTGSKSATVERSRSLPVSGTGSESDTVENSASQVETSSESESATDKRSITSSNSPSVSVASPATGTDRVPGSMSHSRRQSGTSEVTRTANTSGTVTLPVNSGGQGWTLFYRDGLNIYSAMLFANRTFGSPVLRANVINDFTPRQYAGLCVDPENNKIYYGVDDTKLYVADFVVGGDGTLSLSNHRVALNSAPHSNYKLTALSCTADGSKMLFVWGTVNLEIFVGQANSRTSPTVGGVKKLASASGTSQLTAQTPGGFYRDGDTVTWAGYRTSNSETTNRKLMAQGTFNPSTDKFGTLNFVGENKIYNAMSGNPELGGVVARNASGCFLFGEGVSPAGEVLSNCPGGTQWSLGDRLQ